MFCKAENRFSVNLYEQYLREEALQGFVYKMEGWNTRWTPGWPKHNVCNILIAAVASLNTETLNVR